MAKFRKKPVVIEAEQYTEHGKLVRGMCDSLSCHTAGNARPHVHTIHGAADGSKGWDQTTGLPDGQVVNLEVGDWVIPEPDDKHFYPCKPDIFEATYEPA